MVVFPLVPVIPVMARLLGRTAVEVGAQPRQGATAMLYLRPGDIGPRGQGIADHGDCASLQGCIDVRIAVGAAAAHGHETPSRLYPSAVVVQARDGRITLLRNVFRPIQQLEEVHLRRL